MVDDAVPLTLIVVSGPPGSGKTTLAHQIARAAGCPAVSRDEIKEGMALATPGFTPGEGDELTMRTLPVFFAVLRLLLEAGVTTVAEAAFQDRVWRPRLEPLLPVALLRVVHCTTDPEVAFARVTGRRARDGARRAHPDPDPGDREAYVRRLRAFDRLRLDVPSIEVDTTSGYRPSLAEVTAFAAGQVTGLAPKSGQRGGDSRLRPETWPDGTKPIRGPSVPLANVIVASAMTPRSERRQLTWKSTGWPRSRVRSCQGRSSRSANIRCLGH